MKAVRIKLRQNQASYTREETVNNRMTYPLPQYSTIIGALHNACSYASYHEMNVSVQGKYRNMQREVYLNHTLLKKIDKDRGILIYLKNPNLLSSGFVRVAEAMGSQGESNFIHRKKIQVYDEEKFQEYINIETVISKAMSDKKKEIDEIEKAWKKEKNKINDKLKKLDSKSQEAVELKKTIYKRDNEIKEMEDRRKLEKYEKLDEPKNHYKLLIKGVQTQEVLYDVELVIHVSADDETLKDIIANQNNLVCLGRSEDFIELVEIKEVELSSDIDKTYELNDGYSMYVDISKINTDETGDEDYFLTSGGSKKPAKGTIYYVSKDYRIEAKKRVFNKIPCLYSSYIAIDESSQNALCDIDGGYIVNLN